MKKVGEFDRHVDARLPPIAKQAGANESDVRKLFQTRTKALGKSLAPTFEARLLATIGNLAATRAGVGGVSDPDVLRALDAAIAALRKIARFYDNTPPAIAIVEPPSNSVTNDNTPFIRVTYSDALSGVDLSTFRITENAFVRLTPFAAIGPTEATLTVPPEKAFPDGRRFLAAQMIDNAGNSAMAESQVLVDTRPPAIAIAAPAPGSMIDTLAPLFVMQFTDAVNGIETSGVDVATLVVLINGRDRTALFTVSPVEARFQPADGGATSGPDPIVVEGTNTIEIFLKDRATNQGIASATVTVVLPPPPVAELRIRLEKVSGDNQVGLTNRCLKDALVWRAVNADTGEALEGIPTQAEFASGDGIIVEAPGLSTVTNVQGQAGVRVIPGPATGALSVRVSVSGDTAVTPATFNVEARLPRIDLAARVSGPQTAIVQGNCGIGKVAIAPPPYGGGASVPPGPFAPTGEKGIGFAYPGEAIETVLGVRVTDAAGLPVAGVEVRSFLIDFAGDARVMEGVVEFMPSKALTDVAGDAFFVAIVPPGVPFQLLRLRFELPEFDSGDAEHTPLGCNWIAAVVDSAGQSAFIEAGQGQIALPGTRVANPLVVRTRLPQFDVIFFTTQPGDRLEVLEGTGQGSGINPLTGIQQLTVRSSAASRIALALTLGPAPLPRTVVKRLPSGFDGFAVGGPEVRFVRRSVPQDNTSDPFVSTPQIFPIDVIDTTGQLVPVAPTTNEVFLEKRAPVNSPSAEDIAVHSLDLCGDPIPDAIASANQSVSLSMAEANARFKILRSGPVLATSEELLLDPGQISSGPIQLLASGQRVLQARLKGRLKEFVTGDPVNIRGLTVDTTRFPNLLLPDGTSKTTLTADVEVEKKPKPDVGGEEQPIMLSFSADKGTVTSPVEVKQTGNLTTVYTSPALPANQATFATITAILQDGTNRQATVRVFLDNTYNFNDLSQSISSYTDTVFRNPFALLTPQERQDPDAEKRKKFSEAAIQRFLQSQGSFLADPEKFTFENQTASQILNNAAFEFNVNPKVLLATLQKEQRLVINVPVSPGNDSERVLFAFGCGPKGFVPDVDNFAVQANCAARAFSRQFDAFAGEAVRQKREGQVLKQVPRNYVFTEGGSTKRTNVSILINNSATFAQFQYTPNVNFASGPQVGGGVLLFVRLWNQFGF